MRVADPIPLHDGPAPGSEDWTHVERRYWSELWATEVVANVVVPTITPVFPDGDQSGVAVLIAPGGGFFALSIASEGFDVAAGLAAVGITSFVLSYRTVPGGLDPIADLVAALAAGGTVAHEQMAAAAPLAAADGRSAMRLVRARADDFGVDPARLGIMGFSAGGNVAVRVAYDDDAAVRPDFVASVYASTRGLELGDPPAGSGPMFIALATDDELGLAGDSIALYETWRSAGLPVELHAYATGGHGFGMRTKHLLSDGWLGRFLEWSAVMT